MVAEAGSDALMSGTDPTLRPLVVLDLPVFWSFSFAMS